ncbi:MAG: hypothetical protein QOG35_1059 [Solirubrobacteraceae bacterium]|nr:hypothetical protein [Solirubrobacteraceae bacterium]
MHRRASWPRTAALLAAGALAVHELRYLLAFGTGADHALAGDGHAYLSVVHPAVGRLAAVALAPLVRVCARGGAVERQRRGTITRAWIAASARMAAIYAAQELAEGRLAAGHPGGLAALSAHGGWLAVPAALAVGALVALFLREAPRAVRRARAVAAALPRVAGAPVRALALASPQRPRTAVLARHLAGRAPPALTV